MAISEALLTGEYSVIVKIENQNSLLTAKMSRYLPNEFKQNQPISTTTHNTTMQQIEPPRKRKNKMNREELTGVKI